MLLLEALEQTKDTGRPGAATDVPSPARQMRILLEVHRENGCQFDLAWRKAWRKVKWPYDTEHRREWKSTLKGSVETWRSCYEGSPADDKNYGVFDTLDGV